MYLGGYTGIPDTLSEAQAMIVRLFDQQKLDAQVQTDSLRVQREALAMIEAARNALNAVEAGAPEDIATKDRMIDWLADKMSSRELPVEAIKRAAFEAVRGPSNSETA
ncbi:MAG: hypothetical protein WBE72_01075 [Terracidiphilus sp.]